MVSRKKKINQVLGKLLMGAGIIFLLYVGYMYYAYYCTDWQHQPQKTENIK